MLPLDRTRLAHPASLYGKLSYLAAVASHLTWRRGINKKANILVVFSNQTNLPLKMLLADWLVELLVG